MTTAVTLHWDKQTLKNLQFLSLGVSICLDVISIETFDLDICKNHVSTVEIFSTVQNPSLDSLDYPKILIYLDFCQCLDRDLNLVSLKKDISMRWENLDVKRKSWHFQNPCLDSLDYPKISIYLDFCQCLDWDLDLDSLKKGISTCRENLNTFKSWSRSRPRLFSTVETPRLNVNFTIKSRLMWSLWDREKLITLIEWQ